MAPTNINLTIPAALWIILSCKYSAELFDYYFLIIIIYL